MLQFDVTVRISDIVVTSTFSSICVILLRENEGTERNIERWDMWIPIKIFLVSLEAP